MNQVLVSIIIPAYNVENYISETIQSIINQTHTNWELIVVNDGATDNTEQVIAPFVKQDERITLINKKNSGVSDTRNIGINLAKGDYIAFLDADDTWEISNLEEKVKVLENNTIDWVYSDVKLINHNTEIIGEMCGKDEKINEHFLLWEGAVVVPCPCSNALIKRKCLTQNPFDNHFSTAADQDFVFDLSKKYTSERIPKLLVNYRVLPNSMSRNIAVMEKDHIGVYKKAAKNGLFHSFGFQQKCFSNLYLILAGSWWKDGNNKMRGVYFIVKALLFYPPHIVKVIKRVFK